MAFVRGPWCPYCTLALEALEEARPSNRKAGRLLGGDLAHGHAMICAVRLPSAASPAATERCRRALRQDLRRAVRDDRSAHRPLSPSWLGRRSAQRRLRLGAAGAGQLRRGPQRRYRYAFADVDWSIARSRRRSSLRWSDWLILAPDAGPLYPSNSPLDGVTVEDMTLQERLDEINRELLQVLDPSTGRRSKPRSSACGCCSWSSRGWVSATCCPTLRCPTGRPGRRQRGAAGARPAGNDLLPRALVPLLQPDAARH